MKLVLTTLLTTCIFIQLYAQNANLDKEKLLEFYQNQRYAEAGQYLASIYPNNTSDYAALSQIAYCYMMAGKLPDAEKIYSKMDSIQPKTIAVLSNLASINARRGNNFAAIRHLQSIINIDSTNFNTYKRLADLVDSTDLKLFYLKKANKLNNTDADVAFDLARAYRSGKQYLPAFEVLQKAINADTGNFILQKAILPIGNDLNRYKEVIATGNKLLKSANADADAVKDIAKAYFFSKDYNKCLSLLKMLDKWGMQNETTLYYTTLCYRELKNYGMAITTANKLLEEAISPNITNYYSLLANIYEINHQLNNSINSYKRGLTFSENSGMYYRMALLYDFKLKQPQTALKYYRLYVNSKDLTKDEEEQINYVKNRILNLTKPMPRK